MKPGCFPGFAPGTVTRRAVGSGPGSLRIIEKGEPWFAYLPNIVHAIEFLPPLPERHFSGQPNVFGIVALAILALVIVYFLSGKRVSAARRQIAGNRPSGERGLRRDIPPAADPANCGPFTGIRESSGSNECVVGPGGLEPPTRPL
jgi:hypothetical protein